MVRSTITMCMFQTPFLDLSLNKLQLYAMEKRNTKFPRIKRYLWKGHLWNPSYYIETIGSISEEAIRKYIEAQKKA